MKCTRCRFNNESGAQFCGNCGAPLTAKTSLDSDRLMSFIKCKHCGSSIPPDSQFCEVCGDRMAERPVVVSQVMASAGPRPTSGAWWLMPIFLGWVGGVVSWLVVREADSGKARKLLWTGIAMSVFWVLLGIGGTALSWYLDLA